MPLVAITRQRPQGDPAARLAAVASVRQWDSTEAPSLEDLATLVAGCSAVLCMTGDPINAELVDRLPELRLIAVASAGYDSIDVQAAAQRAIAVTNTPGVLSNAVADLTIGLMLSARRRVVEADRYVRRGQWAKGSIHLMVGEDLHDATLGIVGFGAIGQEVATRAGGFRMRVVYHNRSLLQPERAAGAEAVSLDELLQVSDVVSLHVPLTPETHHLIGARELRLMKPTATLVNTARGAVVDQEALVRALTEGWIGSAGLDVQAREPNPDPDDPLLALPNCVLLPHIGSATRRARERMFTLAAGNIEAHLAGRPLLTPVPGSFAPGSTVP